MAVNYWNGGAWAAISTAALYSSYAGTVQVEYPVPPDFDGSGNPCGAVGRPTVRIKLPWLTDTGFDFWRDRFSAPGTQASVTFDIQVFNAYTGTEDKFTGKLVKPRFGSVGIGAVSGQTVYRDVEIVIYDCATSTH